MKVKIKERIFYIAVTPFNHPDPVKPPLFLTKVYEHISKQVVELKLEEDVAEDFEEARKLAYALITQQVKNHED